MKNAALAGQNSNSPGQFLGPASESSVNTGSTLNLVNLGSDTSATDLRNTTGTTVDSSSPF